MKVTNRLFLLFGVMYFLSLSCLKAQDVHYSKDQIVGKWVLKTASFNGQSVPLADVTSRISFEFALNGKVTYLNFDGKLENGRFLLKENKLIDPNVAEYLHADIISLTKDGLVLEMKEDKNKIIMTFELEVLE